LAFSYWVLLKRVKNSTKGTIYIYTSYFLISLSLLFNPAISNIYTLLSPKPEAADFDNFYKEPHITKEANDSKNLVLIYAEGLERTYFDETIFPGLIKGLRELESKSTYFTNIKQVRGTISTMGGMVASQCGIPLLSPVYGPDLNNSMGSMDMYLPSAVSLGDLLHDKGYYLIYYGGAKLSFAGKGKFYSTHKFDDVCGKTKLLPKLINKSYKTGWGLYDDSLFDLAYQRFMELSTLYNKFGLFLLTLDTHFPDGYPSKSCQDIIYKDGSNAMLNAVACSDYLIREFVNKIMQSPYGAKTVVVIVSDHLAMKNTASKLLNKRERTNLFMIIESSVKEATKIQKLGSTLDIGTTILPFIGYKGSIGLGRNLNDPNQSISEIEYIQKNLLSWKPSILRFWNFPKIQESIEIDITNETIKIAGRLFDIPVLIELNDKLETTLKFTPCNDLLRKFLANQVLTLDKNTPFLLIDECKNVDRLDKTLGQTGFCLIAGKGGKYYKNKINENIKLTSDDVRRFASLAPNFQVLRIAHAGGGIKQKTYTNSHEALDYSIKNGFLYFELDFSFTKDGHLVCIHDWKGSFKKTFGFEAKERPTLETFESLVKNASEFKNCTLDSLISWMKQNPSAFIITDIKEDNLKALRIMSKKIPGFERRIIPQIYNPKNYNRVKSMGYKQIIWTLYRYRGTNADVLKWVDKFKKPFAITMPKKRATSNLPRELAKKHIPTYVHTVNKLEEMNKFINNFGLTEIYTDFLHPCEGLMTNMHYKTADNAL